MAQPATAILTAILVFTTALWRPASGSQAVGNSTLACTRGENKSSYNINCLDLDPDGIHKVIVVKKVYYGTTTTNRGCSRRAPFENCCVQDGSECIFERDDSLGDFLKTCGATSQCFPSAKAITIPPNTCDAEVYPTISSFTFLEYECLKVSALVDFCDPHPHLQSTGELYLDSNNIQLNTKISDSSCICAVVTHCGSTLTFTALAVDLKNKDDVCIEELFFEDMVELDVTSNMTCGEKGKVENQLVFLSQSNAASVRMVVTGAHTGKVWLRVSSSDPSDTLHLFCGDSVTMATQLLEGCPSSLAPLPTTTTTTEANTASPTPSTSPLPSSSEGTQPQVSSSSSSSMNAGTIVGIVLASLAIILVSVLIILFLCHRRKQSSGDEHFDDGQSDPGYDNPTFGELYSREGDHDNIPDDDDGDSQGATGWNAGYLDDDDESKEKSGKVGAQAVNPVYDNNFKAGMKTVLY